MRPFEENFTAWVDGRLAGAELAAFERELEEHPEALEDRAAALKVGNLMRAHLSTPPLRNPDFFNHQLLRAIEADQPSMAATAREARPARHIFWTLRRMAASGAFCLVLATALYFAAVPKTNRQVRKNQEYLTKVLNAHTDDPEVTATTFHSKKDNVTVLWLDGLEYMPENYKLK